MNPADVFRCPQYYRFSRRTVLRLVWLSQVPAYILVYFHVSKFMFAAFLNFKVQKLVEITEIKCYFYIKCSPKGRKGYFCKVSELWYHFRSALDRVRLTDRVLETFIPSLAFVK